MRAILFEPQWVIGIMLVANHDPVTHTPSVLTVEEFARHGHVHAILQMYVQLMKT